MRPPHPVSFLSSYIPVNGEGIWGKDNSTVNGFHYVVWYVPSATGGPALQVKCCYLALTFVGKLHGEISALIHHTMSSQEWSVAVTGCGGLISSCHHGGGPTNLRLQGGHLPPKGNVRRQLPAPASHSVQLHLPSPSSDLSQDQDLQLSRGSWPGQQVCPA